MRLRILAGIALCALAALSAVQAGSDEQLDLVRRSRDRVDPRVFLQIAASRDEAALQRLQTVPPLLAEEGVLDSAYGAFTRLRGGELEEKALGYLMREALHGRSPAHQHSATRALTSFGAKAAERLLRIARTHDDPLCRSLALTPLLPELLGRGDPATCRLLLNSALLTPDQVSGVAAVLSQFRDRESQRLLAQRALDPAASEAWRVLAVDCLASIEGEFAAQAVRESSFEGRGAAQLRALKVLSERDPQAALLGLRRLIESGDEAEATEAILTLAALRDASPDWVEELGRIARSASPAARLATVRALAQAHSRESLSVLHGMLADPDWRVQLLCVQALRGFRQKESLPRLIAALPGARRRVADEVLSTLRSMTGLDLGRGASAWEGWYRVEGPGFRLPSVEEAQRSEEARAARRAEQDGPRTATFYGLKLESDRVAFVIDTSNSMSEAAHGERSAARATNRLEVAKEQLCGLLTALVGDVRFNIIAFSSGLTPWRAGLVALDEPARQEALVFVRGLRVDGGTAIYDALERALEDPDVDTLYVLTDGEPSGGRVTQIARIRELIGRRARQRMVRLHGVAVGQPSILLEGLAQDTGGQYRYVP